MSWNWSVGGSGSPVGFKAEILPRASKAKAGVYGTVAECFNASLMAYKFNPMGFSSATAMAFIHEVMYLHLLPTFTWLVLD